jgi:hypothetical protein
MSTTSWAPLALLFFSPALISATKSRSSASLLRLLVADLATRSRSSASLLRLLGADLVAIVVVISTYSGREGDMRWVAVFHFAALAALVLTATLLGGVLRFGIDHWYARVIARRAAS